MGTRRACETQLDIEADRWGLLVLAQEALRLAAGNTRDEGSFDAATYLEELTDRFTLRRVHTQPRWWSSTPEG